MKFEILKPQDYKKTHWSGGTTTELYIYPKSSNLQNLDFQFRISTATVETESSTFTIFPGVSRIILPLLGEMTLIHDNENPVYLKSFAQDSFSGSSITKCFGKVTDFNLMTRGNAKGTIKMIELQPGEHHTVRTKNTVIYCFSGEIKIENQYLNTHETLVLNSVIEQPYDLEAISKSMLIQVELKF
jgi:environmental stress-induced protein Ves